ncbi:MAG: SpoIIE family protein phosphatase [Clostridia bacterium]|nr:SpoIIE family protein phosphatase [Clostridia bacterium]
MQTESRTVKGTKRAGLWEDRRRAVETVLYHLLFAALGALAQSAELLFAVHPFGVALAGAATLFFPAVTLGAAAFALLTKRYFSLVALAATAVGRFAFFLYARYKKANTCVKKGDIFHERVSYRATLVAVVLFATGLYRLILGEFRFYDLFGLILSVLAAALSTVLYAGMFERKDRLFPYCREAGVAAVVLTGIFAMRQLSFFGVYPAAVAAALAAFWLVAHRGLSWGAVGGALAGLCFDYRMAPAFLLCGLLFGLLEKSSRGGGILCGSGGAVLWAFAVARTEGIMLLLPALLTAGALFLAGDSAGLVEGSPGYRRNLIRRRAAAQSLKASEQVAGEVRFREISGALSDLSGTFFELSGKLRRPGLQDLRHLCDKAFDEVCPGCRNRDICWGSDYHTTATTVGALGTRLHSHGEVGREQIPATLAARCIGIPHILEKINQGAQKLSEEALRGDKTSVVATDYAALGRIMTEVLEDNREDFAPDVPTGERIAERLQRLGYALESVSVCGKQHRRVILRGLRLPGRHLKIRELRQVLEQHCHFTLGSPEVQESEGGYDMIFPQRPGCGSVTVKETRAKRQGEGRYCGDSVATVSSKNGYDYAFLCDGMGSGNHAALTSALASSFLSRMLQAGGRADTVLKMLNGFLSARATGESESSTTVDLLEIDRICMEASLFKCGAAPTFLLRGGTVTRLTSRTAPVGILESLDAERIRFEVQPGDVIVQVSDGITGGEEDCPWLTELLTTHFDGDCDSFVRTVFAKAARRGNDDMSILMTRITDTHEGERASA